MKFYQVGGAVRDKLLDRPVVDRDWVVVGSAPEDLIALGYKRVGAEFPVFLHPQTHEEYALARTERKVAPGYKGFQFTASPGVSLEDDLRRRDLTINAMAEDEAGRLIDPFGGLEDLRKGLLRHVSQAFVEDPVRILRVARFAARFGFRVADETLTLMRDIVRAGEVDALVPERVWLELERALGEKQARRFFEVLKECEALRSLLPELDALFGVPQPARYHPEIDTGVHVLMVLDQATGLSDDTRVRFAALVHDLGKGTTPKDEWPSHKGHELRSSALIDALCRRFRIPNEYRDLAKLVARYHSHCHRLAELRPATVLDTLKALDAFRKPERFQRFLLACQADAQGRGGLEDKPYPQGQRFLEAWHAASRVDAHELVEKGLEGPQIAEAIDRLRLKALTAVLASHRLQGKPT